MLVGLLSPKLNMSKLFVTNRDNALMNIVAKVGRISYGGFICKCIIEIQRCMRTISKVPKVYAYHARAILVGSFGNEQILMGENITIFNLIKVDFCFGLKSKQAFRNE